MHILLACAKMMDPDCQMPTGLPYTIPEFQERASALALELTAYSPDELAAMLGINHRMAIDVYNRYNDFAIETTRRPAASIYSGMVFQQLDYTSMPQPICCQGNRQLSICSFLYGLLRPLDLINPYRLEGKVELPSTRPQTVIQSWRQQLTSALIERVAASGPDNTLLNLASDEMKGFFDWKEVKRFLNIITPTFKVGSEHGPKNVTIYAKMCRGAMARFALTNRFTTVDELTQFSEHGFTISNVERISARETRLDFIANL